MLRICEFTHPSRDGRGYIARTDYGKVILPPVAQAGWYVVERLEDRERCCVARGLHGPLERYGGVTISFPRHIIVGGERIPVPAWKEPSQIIWELVIPVRDEIYLVFRQGNLAGGLHQAALVYFPAGWECREVKDGLFFNQPIFELRRV